MYVNVNKHCLGKTVMVPNLSIKKRAKMETLET